MYLGKKNQVYVKHIKHKYMYNNIHTIYLTNIILYLFRTTLS